MFRKGTQVSCTFKRTLREGIVIKGTTKPDGLITVVLYGGRHQITAPANHFQKTAYVLPKPTPPMEEYSITGYKQNKAFSQETTAFTAKIRRFRGVIADVMNHGTGGCDIYQFKTRDDQITFQEHIRQWATALGLKKEPGAEDLWLEWYVHDRPVGMSDKDFAEKYFHDSLRE